MMIQRRHKRAKTHELWPFRITISYCLVEVVFQPGCIRVLHDAGFVVPWSRNVVTLTDCDGKGRLERHAWPRTEILGKSRFVTTNLHDMGKRGG